MMAEKYCDDVNCPNLQDEDCKLGFNNDFKAPKSYQDIQNRNWGYKMPKACRLKYKKAERQI